MPELNPYESPQAELKPAGDLIDKETRQWNQFYRGVHLSEHAITFFGLVLLVALLVLALTAGFAVGEEIARIVASALIPIASILLVLLHSSGAIKMAAIPSVSRAKAMFRIAAGALILGLIVVPMLPFWIGLRQATSSDLETFIVIFGYSAMLTFLFVVHCAALFIGVIQVGRYVKNSVVIKNAIVALAVLIVTFHLDMFFVQSIFRAGMGNASWETSIAILIAIVGFMIFWSFYLMALAKLTRLRAKKTLEKS
jgi:hypothetical protein